MVSSYAIQEKDPLAPFNDLTFKTELDRWETLNFSFDMEDGQDNRESPHGTPVGGRSRSVSQTGQRNPSSSNIDDALLLAQFAAAGGSLPPQPNDMNLYSVLINYLQAQGVNPASIPPGVLPPPNPNIYQGSFPQQHAIPAGGPWHTQQQQNFSPQSPFQTPNPGYLPGMVHFQNPMSLNPQQHQQQQDHHQHHQQHHHQQQHLLPPTPADLSLPSLSSPQASTSSEASPPSPEPDGANITEDKRRRNTAASARFRIKKKLRNLNLEKQVSELSGRADTLEREAADLRRENGWLKEIVMLKGSRMAGIDISPHTLPNMGQGSSSSGGPAGSSSADVAREESEAEEDEEDSSDDYQPEGKGKAKRRSRKETEKRK
ncbi:hypothetical protein V5O48_005403 [Marasmius crinis-equi]|uniref:BZIP domain-containing protein n=1 Tax=Marasmius crinis-equi TaxID=585013 RepID=A0ABR3FN27_9AGAR